MDIIQIAHEYTGELIKLQKRIFIKNEELDIFKEETIPAIQYCSAKTIESIIRYYKAFVPFLNKNATYLSVGSGTNFLEKEARSQGIFIQCSDIEKTKPIFDPMRRIINVPLDYTAELYGEELIINNCTEHYDYIVFVRYVPWEFNFDEELFVKFAKSCTKYADKMIISVVKNSYDDLRTFLNKRDDIIIKSEYIHNTINFEIDLTKL